MQNKLKSKHNQLKTGNNGNKAVSKEATVATPQTTEGVVMAMSVRTTMLLRARLTRNLPNISMWKRRLAYIKGQ